MNFNVYNRAFLFVQTVAMFATHFLTIGSIFSAAMLAAESSIAATWDTHIHVRGKPVVEYGVEEPVFTGQDAIAYLDEAAIDNGLIISSGYRNPFVEDPARVVFENDFVAEQVKQSSGRLLGLCGVHPLSSFATAELMRCYKELKLVGVKIHPISQGLLFPGMGLNSEYVLSKLLPLFQLTNEIGGVILLDGQFWTEPEIRDLSALASRFPGAKFIFAHFLRGNFDQVSLVKTFSSYGAQNIFLDVSAVPFFYDNGPEKERLKWYMESAAQLLLFASDMPYSVPQGPLTPLSTLNKLKELGFTDDFLTQITDTNPNRLFNNRNSRSTGAETDAKTISVE